MKNLIAPLHYDEGNVTVPQEYQRTAQAGAEQSAATSSNVVVKFIGYTDNIPLEGRDERIYGNHVGISKARGPARGTGASRTRCKLPAVAIESDGKGASQPRRLQRHRQRPCGLTGASRSSSGTTMRSRSCPTEPQLCPLTADAETVTQGLRVAVGTIKPVVYENGKPLLPAGYYAQRLGDRDGRDQGQDATCACASLALPATSGSTGAPPLVYGDDIGLSTARARTGHGHCR